MSALPPKADKGQTSRDVRLVPIGDLSRRSNVSCPKSRAPRRLDVASGALVGVDNVRSIGYKPEPRRHRWQAVCCRTARATINSQCVRVTVTTMMRDPAFGLQIPQQGTSCGIYATIIYYFTKALMRDRFFASC